MEKRAILKDWDEKPGLCQSQGQLGTARGLLSLQSQPERCVLKELGSPRPLPVNQGILIFVSGRKRAREKSVLHVYGGRKRGVLEVRKRLSKGKEIFWRKCPCATCGITPTLTTLSMHLPWTRHDYSGNLETGCYSEPAVMIFFSQQAGKKTCFSSPDKGEKARCGGSHL